MYIRIAVKVFSNNLLTYSVPEHIDQSLCKSGRLVEVPIGKQSSIGVIYDHVDQANIESEVIRPITSVLPEVFALTEYQMHIAKFIADYWHQPISLVFSTLIPQYLKNNYLLATKNHLAETANIHLNHKTDGLKSQTPLLSSQQQQIFNSITATPSGTHLLYGITGSGKTNIYLELAKQTLAAGKQVLWLQPEIGLVTKQAKQVAQYLPTVQFHSRMSAKQQWQSYLTTNGSQPYVLLGSRSAVLCKMPNLGLIIVDEEHDPSYFQVTPLTYLAKNVAISIAHKQKIPIVLGSATPSLESLQITDAFHHQEHKTNAKLHKLEHRFQGAKLPTLTQIKPAVGTLISDRVKQIIQTTLARKEQVLLFLNLRGFSRKLMCNQCAWISQCKACDKSLVYHLAEHYLSCHLCNKKYPVPLQCPKCQAMDWSFQGYGTEQVTQQCKHLFPAAKIIQFDSDTTTRKGTLEKLISQVESGEPCIIVATQMLTKGFHFEQLNSVVMLQLDYMMNDQSYRNSELIYAMIFQTAGRAGRISKGEVFIESNANLPIAAIQKGEYLTIAKSILKQRREIFMPPTSYMIAIKAKSKDAAACRSHLLDICSYFKRYSDIKLIGPAQGNPEKIESYFRYSVILLSKNRSHLHRAVRQHPKLYNKRFAKVKHQIIVDPYEEW